MKSSVRVLAYGETNVGKKRDHNEDNFVVVDKEHLYVVADGMGGHASGEVASQIAIDTVKEFFEDTSQDPEITWPYKMDRTRGYDENRLMTSIKLANLRIFESAQKDTKLKGMGTTLVSVFVSDHSVLIGHVGDSRVYRLRDQKLEQLTEDHSLLNDYLKMRQLSDEEIKNFPHKNVIVRALGMKETVKVDIIPDKPKSGDIYILCSDGLCGPVTDEEIEDISNESTELNTICKSLIQKANENGGPDNITVVAAKILGIR